MAAKEKVVLAYSGGLDTSVILRWLLETYKVEVVAVSVDLGQNEDTEAIRRKALQTGAKKAIVVKAREEFVRDFVFPAVRANARYEDQYLLGTSLARPLIAKALVEVARREGATAFAHGATGKGNDQVRFELTAAALAPELKAIVPWRDPNWKFVSRPQMIEYARSRGIPVPVTVQKPYSSDPNLMHISYEGGILEDPWRAPDNDMFQLTVAPEDAPDKAEEILVAFVAGNAVAVNGRKLSPAKLLSELNRLAGRNGVGRVDLVENRYVGMKSRGVYEAPGATVLHQAHRAIETLTLDREAMFLKDSLMPQYARLAYFGFWFAPERVALQTLIDQTQENVTGTARLKLYKGSCIVTGRKSPWSLYDQALVSFDEAGGYDQTDATGFIRLSGLRLRTFSRRAAAPAAKAGNRPGRKAKG